MKSIKKLFVVMAIATLIISFGLATAYATNEVKSENKNTGVTIDSKEKKVSSYKIIWNYNGGKIGNKKTKITTVKKGSKIGKLPATPKRSSYSFKGWYTKKSGGKKISKNTKPTKSVTYYSQWKKKTNSRVLTTDEKKLLGVWGPSNRFNYAFYNDGTFLLEYESGPAPNFQYQIKGKWRLSGNTFYMTERLYRSSGYSDGGGNYGSWGPHSDGDLTMKVEFGSDEIGPYFRDMKADVKYWKMDPFWLKSNDLTRFK